MQRRYVEVEGRRVLYRRAGSGPPLVMLHGSPGNSEMLAGEMAAASEHFTCIALDTPGFGGSDPLPGDVLSVGNLAQATAGAMRALGLPPCPVYGTHTGALIAIELGVHHTGQVSGVVLEGLPIFNEEEIATLFDGYFAPMKTDPLGGHLVSTWTRFRDQFTWFPWASRDVRRLNPVDRPHPEDIHHWVMMYYRSCRTYIPAYRAACHHGHLAYVAAEALTLPAVYMASAEDMLYPHLDRLPRLKANQRIERLPHNHAAKHAAITAFCRAMPQAPAIFLEPAQKPAGREPALQFVDTAGGQVFVRCYGNPAAAPSILLHDAPGSGLALDGIAQTLADRRYVVVPDLPGNGESDDPPTEDILAASADAVLAIVDVFSLANVTIAAVGCGCAVAALLASEPRVAEIIVDRPLSPDSGVVAAIAPDLPMTAEATHWLKAWLMVRDGQIYNPWYAGNIAAQRSTQGNFDADWLHAQTFEIMKARTSYHRLPRAAWGFDSIPFLARATVPVSRADIFSLSGAES